MFLKGEYYALSIEEAVERTRKIYTLLELNGVNVIRVGLQPSEDLREDGVCLLYTSWIFKSICYDGI